jgi:phytoene/squalene synthetase
MEQLFHDSSFECSKIVTRTYSTSFSIAVKLLAPSIRTDIYNIYGFVRYADEIVDSFLNYNKELLLDRFEEEYYISLKEGISLNPIINSFIKTVKKCNISDDMVSAFLKSMRLDLTKSDYNTQHEYEEYIYGSADVVGLMCLKVFVGGDDQKYNELKSSAMSLGTAFQKVNFLRDLKDDYESLNRSYFPNVNIAKLTQEEKNAIVKEIEADFAKAYEGIVFLPVEARLGVYTAYVYYKKLLKKINKVSSDKILSTRIRVSNPNKMSLVAKSYFIHKLNML